VSIGRCAGCGSTGPDKNLRAHVRSCSDFAELYRRDPALAMDPVPEYQRWQRDSRPAERVAGRHAAIDDEEARRAAMHRRFATPPDILAG
jgi:hypothetical protein